MKARFVNESEEYSDNVAIQKWVDELVNLLEKHKVTQFGGSIPIENINVVNISDGSADITCSVNTGKVRFDVYFLLRDQRRWNDTVPKWEAEVSISSPAKRGYFGKKATGKNTSPRNLIDMLSNIFDLKYRR